MLKKYDYIVVGAGLFGSIVARELSESGYSVLVVEKRKWIAGNIFTKNIDGIEVHKYGAHIFHTSDKEVWDYVNRFSNFEPFINSPLANYHGEIYNLPFNMNTFCKIWPDVKTPDEARAKIDDEISKYAVKTPSNLEEQAISLVGKTIFTKLIKEYTEKQWGKQCDELPAFIIKRIPVRFTFDNNYFDDVYQGIPKDGYTNFVKNILNGIDIVTDCDFIKERKKFLGKFDKVIFTGSIDEYFDYCYGVLEYRSVKFKEKKLNIESFQDNAVVNYTSHDVPYTRIIEHKFFNNAKTNFTIISEEYSDNWKLGMDRFYPVNDEKNNLLYHKYAERAKSESNVFFGGRLGLYKYLDMDDVVRQALDFMKEILNEKN